MSWLVFVTSFSILITLASSYAIESHVVGGVEADPERFPFICGLNYAQLNFAFICGSSIITPDFVLTAAHCIIGPNEDYTVHCGTWNNSVFDEDRQIRNVKEQILHEGYDPWNIYATLEYDIAVVC